MSQNNKLQMNKNENKKKEDPSKLSGSEIKSIVKQSKKDTEKFLRELKSTFKTISKKTLTPESEVLRSQIFSFFRSFLGTYDASSEYTSSKDLQQYVQLMNQIADKLETLAVYEMPLPNFFGDLDKFKYAQETGIRTITYNRKNEFGLAFDTSGVITYMKPNSSLHNIILDQVLN